MSTLADETAAREVRPPGLQGVASVRVALLAGSLTQGGAEKQLVYMSRALRNIGAAVRVYSLTSGEFYEAVLRDLSLAPVYIGGVRNPLLRAFVLANALREFRPQIVQAAHFFVNLHVTLAARLLGAHPVGAVRNDAIFDVRENGRWGKWLLKAPPALIANSTTAAHNAVQLGAARERVHVLPNVIDLDEFDQRSAQPVPLPRRSDEIVAVAACRLVAAKRLDRFIDAVAAVRREGCALRGVIVGEGPERPVLERHARESGQLGDGVTFLGRRDDIPALLRSADLLVVSSDHEGFPNVILEAMAGRLPVVATAAGDARAVVEEGETGFVVAVDDLAGMVAKLRLLARTPSLRRRLGEAGRRRVERLYSERQLGGRLLDIYRAMAADHGSARLAAVVGR